MSYDQLHADAVRECADLRAQLAAAEEENERIRQQNREVVQLKLNEISKARGLLRDLVAANSGFIETMRGYSKIQMDLPPSWKSTVRAYEAAHAYLAAGKDGS